MRTCLRLLTLLLILTVGAVRPAHAEGWWDWLAKLSGPGGSSGEGSASLTVYCQPDRADSGLRGEGGGWFNLSGVSERDGQTLEHPPCFFVDYRRYRSPADESWLSVRTEFYEAGVSVRLMPPFEVGFSAGVVQFNSEGVTTTRPSLTVPPGRG